MWERGELGVGGLMRNERCGSRGIWFTVILETSDICSLREMRKQMARRKKYIVIVGPMNGASHGMNY